jgi:hypothetical protein
MVKVTMTVSATTQYPNSKVSHRRTEYTEKGK